SVTVGLIMSAIILIGSSSITAFSVRAQGRGEGRPGGQNMSPEEQNLAKGIMTAADPAAKLKAAAELIKKYPKTSVRPRVAQALWLIETEKKPANLDDAAWKQYKTTLLPSVYQSMGLLNLVKGDRAEAKARFMKASELAPSDAFNLLMLAGIINEEYQNE